MLDVIQLILAPVFFVRYKLCYSKWGKYGRAMYLEACNIYNERVPETIKGQINEKI